MIRTSSPRIGAPARTVAALVLALALLAAACGDDGDDAAADEAAGDGARGHLVVSAIPDQDPEQLQRLYGLVVDHLSEALDLDVTYVPVTDYAASVSLFRAGDLDLVWFGGLTGVQARLQAPGARAVAQRDIDERFRSVFIAGTAAGIEPFDDVEGLTALRGRRLTFGSESSTSGRLMPQHFLDQAGVSLDELQGEVGFSGSHDATIDLVEAGSYEVGALNEQVWDARVAIGTVDTDAVTVVHRTPEYHDYHWVLGPDAIERLGDGVVADVQAAFEDLDPADPDDAAVLDLFGAQRFIPTEDANYAEIEAVARDLDLIR